MIGPYDLAAIVVMCVTAVVCFVIRSGWVTSLEEIHEDVDAVRELPEALKNLRETVIANGLVAERLHLEVQRMKHDKTNSALARAK